VIATLSHSWHMSMRDLRSLARQPLWIAISLAQPLVYLLLYGALFEAIVDLPGFSSDSYIDFLAPGIVVVTALFSAGWAGLNVINDLDAGVIDRFLVTPVRRGAIISARLVAEALVTVIQAIIVVVLALVVGASFPGGVGGVAILIGCSVLLGAAIGGYSMALALVVRRAETVVGAVQLVLLPLGFLSSVFIERALMPGWIRAVADFNPVDWATVAGREAVSADPAWGTVLTRGGYLVAFALVGAWLAARAFRAYQRSI
jgi:ABC-2 type transport system permease protein